MNKFTKNGIPTAPSLITFNEGYVLDGLIRKSVQQVVEQGVDQNDKRLDAIFRGIVDGLKEKNCEIQD